MRGSSKNDKIIIVIVMTKSNDTLITSLSEDGMNKSRREIVNKFITDAQEILGGHLVRTVLYGSYARGDYRENSDIDLLFLTNSSDEENREQESRLYDLAFEYEMDYGVDISVIVKSRDHFEYWLGALPFYDNIESEGMVLYG